MENHLTVDVDSIPDDVLTRMNITRDEFRSRQVWALEREQRAPRVGGMAPDFVLERLLPNGARSGQQARLSDSRGWPVGLVFGAYT